MRNVFRTIPIALFTLIFTLTIATRPLLTAAQTVSIAESNKRVAQNFREAYISGDIATLAQLVAQDYLSHNASPILPPGLAGVQLQSAKFHAAFPNAKSTIDQLTAETDLVTIAYTTSGTQTGVYQGVAASNMPMTFSGIDLYRLKDGKIVEGWDQGDALSLAKQLYAPYPAQMPIQNVPVGAVKQIALLTPGSFMEGIAADSRGDLYLSDSNFFTHSKAITRVTRDGTVSKFADVPISPAGQTGVLAFAPDGSLYLTVIDVGNPSNHGVWRFTPDGQGKPFATLPPNAQPNGITVNPAGDILVADSALGAIWKIDPKTAKPTLWLQHPLLAHYPVISGLYPGANGIHVWNSMVYVTVSATANVIRIPVNSDSSAGAPVIHATGVPGDDFAIDSKGNLYVTTHLFNTIVRVTPDGSKTIIAGPDQGIVGAPMAVFGTQADDSTVLYVANDGGAVAILFGVGDPKKKPQPTVVRLDMSSFVK